jgi:hypothetical protein
MSEKRVDVFAGLRPRYMLNILWLYIKTALIVFWAALIFVCLYVAACYVLAGIMWAIHAIIMHWHEILYFTLP